MEIKLYAWLLAFSLFLLVVHGDQKTRNSIRQNSRSLSEAARFSRRTRAEVGEYSPNDGGDDDEEKDEDEYAASGDGDDYNGQLPDDFEEDAGDQLGVEREAEGDDDEEDEEGEEEEEEEDADEGEDEAGSTHDEEDEEDPESSGVPDDVPPTTSRSPTLTRCQEMRSHKQASGFVGYRPLCTESGAFEPKQCYETTKECWCVDSEGNQLGEVFRAPVEATCPPKGVPPPSVTHAPSRTDSDEFFIVDATVRSAADSKTPRPADDPNKDPGMEPLPPKTWFEYLLHEPLILAAVIGGSILFLALLVLVLMFCIYRMRKKDEGSYSLDEPRQTFSYTRAKDQEFFA